MTGTADEPERIDLDRTTLFLDPPDAHLKERPNLLPLLVGQHRNGHLTPPAVIGIGHGVIRFLQNDAAYSAVPILAPLRFASKVGLKTEERRPPSRILVVLVS